MKKFYTAAVDQIDYVEGIQVIKQLVPKAERPEGNTNRFTVLCNRFLWESSE